jgi:hypothetical protein
MGRGLNHTGEVHFSIRRFNIPWMKIDPRVQYTMGFKIQNVPYDTEMFFLFSLATNILL